MATQYENLGPIYLTAEKYEALKTAGTLEVGREYKIVDWEAQEKLVAGDNITIEDNVISAVDSDNNAYNYINQIADYLFEVQYSTENIDYDYANKYFKALPPTNENGGACTGIYKDGKVLRQLDWYYNNNAEFIVRRPKDELNGIHASIGIASSISDLTKEIVESREYNKKFKMVPFIITDGINDAGLYIQSNVVPELDGGFDLNPTAATECCITMAIRYILDHCASFADVETFFNTIHIYNTSAVPKYNYHFLLVKDNAWEVIELTATGHITVTEGTGENQMPYGIMTNFRTTGLTFNNNLVDWSSVEQYGGGVERYDLATKAFTDDRSFELLRTDLQYTKMYTGATPEWLTELCGETDETYGKLTVMDAVNHQEKFVTLMAKEAQAYANRDRYATDPDTWQTVHSAIYDISEKSIEVCIQERFDKKYIFKLDEPIDLSAYRKSADQDIIDATKQDKLVSGTNLKTINNESLLIGSTNDSDIELVTPSEISDMATKTYTADTYQPWLGDHGKVPSWKTEDPGAGYAFHIPYNFTFTPDANKLDIKMYTVTADGNNTYDEWNNTVPPANSIEAMSYANAGLMTSTDATAVRTTLPDAITAEGTARASADTTLQTNIDKKQDKLVSGTNIKTVNGASILGSGDMAIKTYQAFPSTWTTSGNLQTVTDSMLADSTYAKQGMAYLGGISGTCTPFGYGNVECTVTFMTDNIALLTVSSSDTYPYHWEYNTWSDDYQWKAFATYTDLPSDFKTSTYTIKFVNGKLTWVKES